MTDRDFLRMAVAVGNEQAKPRNFGTVKVKDGKVIASCYNHVHENHDPSAHAEVTALRRAAAKLKNHNLDGCIMYGSHEPCLMCFSCAVWANIGRVVYATAANEQNFSYEFDNVSLQDLAAKLSKRVIIVEHIPLETLTT